MPDLPNGPNRDSQPAFVPHIVDVEASGFGSRSYPIEIGLALASGKRYCALVAPQPEWTHWDSDAQKLHGLSREQIVELGKPPRVVAAELNALLRTQTVYSDGWVVDYPWLRTLFEAAKQEMTFHVSPLEQLLQEQDFAGWDETKQQLGAREPMQRHRASIDALLIQQTYIALQMGSRP